MASLSGENDNPEEYLLDTLNDLDIGFVRISNDGIILNHNLTFNKIFGYNPEESLIGTKTLDYWLNSEESNKFIEILYKNGIVKNYIAPVKKLDGEKIFLQMNFKLNKNSNGEVISSEGTFVDVSERIETEQNLKESEEKYRELLEDIQEGYYILDLKGNYTYVNDYWCKTVGYSKEELLGNNYRLVFDEKTSKELFKMFNQLYESGIPLPHPNRAEGLTNRGKQVFLEGLIDLLYDSEGNKIGFYGFARDITEKIISEQKTKESEVKYKNLSNEFEMILDNIPALVFYKDTENRFIHVNKSLADAYKMKKEALTGKSLFELYPEEEAQTYWDDDLEVIKRGKPKLNYEESWQAADGLRWALTSKIPYIDEDGDIKGIIGFSRDITERKKAEQKLKESEANYKILSNELETILDLIPGMLFCKDKNDVVTRVNQNFADLLHSKKEDIIGKTTFDLFPKDQAEVFRKDDVEVINTGLPKLNIEEVADFPDKKIWSSTSKVPYYNYKGEINGVIGLAINITERKKIEQELKESEEKYSNLFQYSNDAIIIHDFEGNILEVNDRAIELFKYPKEEFLALTTLMLRTIEEQEKGEKVSEEISKKGFIRFEFYFKRKDGTIFPAEVSSRAIEMQGKKLIQAVIRDITNRKDSEERLKIFMESAPNTFMFFDSDLNLIDINKIGIKRFPTGTKKEDIIGKNIVELSPDIKKKGRYDEYMEVIKTGKPFFVEEFSPHPKFGNLHISLNAFKVLNGLGIIARDNTERKKAEEALKESEQRLKEAQALGKIGYWEFDITDQHITWSDQVFELYSRDPSLGPPSVEEEAIYYTPDTNERLKEYSRRALEFGEEFDYDFQANLPDGKVVQLAALMRSIKDKSGQIIKLVGTVQDITERKKIEQKLKESEERYRLLSENSTDLICVLDEKFEVDYVNEVSLNRMSGYEKQDIIGKKALKFLHPDDISLLMKAFRKKSGRNYNPTQIRLIHKDGNHIWTEINGSLFHDASGKLKILINIRDITEKKVNEQKLKESEEKFRTLFNVAPASIIVSDLESNILLCNQKFCELHGFKKPELVIGRKIQEFIAKKDLPIISKVMKKTLNGIHRDPMQYTMLKEDGTEFQVEATSTGIRDKNGNIIGLIGVAQDITWRKQAEQKLKESEKFVKSILDTIPNHIYIYDFKTNQNIYSSNSEAMLGYTPEEIRNKRGNSLPNFVHPEDEILLKQLIQKVRKATDNEIVEGEYRLRHKNGKYINIFDSIMVFKRTADGQVSQILGSSIDITERKKAEQKLKESEEKYRNFIQNIQAIAFQGYQDFSITFFDGAVEEITGYATEDFLTGRIKWDQIIYPDDTPINQKKVVAFHSSSAETDSREYRIVQKSGEIRWVLEKVKKIYDNVKKMEGVQGIFVDITQRKEAENELKELSKLKSEFLRRASHELKTPLISIKGFSELILALHEDQLDTSIISKLREINDGCERLQNIINNLLKASRLESPDLQPKFQKEDLSFLIKFCVHELESLAERRNQSIRLDIHNELYANIEKEEIHDVLSNLLTNAIKYTPPMGKIEVKTELKEDSVIVSIKDNGIGFTEEQKTKIFQQFGKIERYGQGLDLGIDGTGLGLYISKRIAEAHGGKIWMESEGKSKGSTFYFTLRTVN